MKSSKILNRTALHKAKFSVLAASITTLMCSGVNASDIEIYRAPSASASATTVLLMLDKSGSMDFIDYEGMTMDPEASYYSPDCPGGYTKRNVIEEVGVIDKQILSYYQCEKAGVDPVMRRIYSLKKGLLQTLLGDAEDSELKPLGDELYIGLATFSGNKGDINAEAKRLDEVYTINYGNWVFPDRVTQSHRKHLARMIVGLNANGGTPTPYAYAEAAAYLLGTQTGGGTHSSSNSNYIPPVSISSQTAESKQCSAQGIYFLTDGRPEPGGSTNTARNLMRNALDNTSFDCFDSPMGNDGPYHAERNGWACIGKLNEHLLLKNEKTNPKNLKILTAVVGFGKDFNGDGGSNDVLEAKRWGEQGEGGWYSGQHASDIVKSFTQFLKTVKTEIPGVSTGTATVPVDALNSSAIQPYGYFPQFVPKVATEQKQQTWYGNLKKYFAVNGSLYGTKSGAEPVMQKDEIKNVIGEWNNSQFDNSSPEIAFRYGALSQLMRGYNADLNPKERIIFTDFTYKDSQIGQNLLLSSFDPDTNQIERQAISTSYNLDATAPYREELMNLLGYENATGGQDLQSLAATSISDRVAQIGAILHSNPILITQSGKPFVNKVTKAVDTTNREDYVLFGSTQGLLHVLDAETGKEKFTFLPKEIIENQSEAFKYDSGNTSGGKEKLYYGIDGEWTAHTVYVSKTDGTLTVNGGSRTIINDYDKEEEINLEGKQWVYGGMRMGGRSYYALDLTNIDRPQVKFHIDPNNRKIHYLHGSTTKYHDISELQHMGQSWSKPTLAYVNWFGTRKLVMLVGGGYDAGGTDGDGLYTTKLVGGVWVKDKRNGYEGYEKPNYDQTNKIGAGVYMFDADNGDLLWSVSGNYKNTTTGSRNIKLKGSGVGMDYSVVSSIKTVDRNNDGLVDHLYFADLKGQAFRVDFNPTSGEFNSQVNKILDISSTKQRFYTEPTFTIHSQGVAAVSFASGNRSSPLYGKNISVTTADDYDGVFVVYDYDNYSTKYPTTTFGTRTLGNTSNGGVTKLRLLDTRITDDISSDNSKRPVINKVNGDGGWYYLFNKEENLTNTVTKGKQILKSFASLVAVEGDLYVPVFDASKDGTTGSCSAGVAGETSLQRFCLPYGHCKDNIFITLGAGIGEPIMGGGRDGDNNKRSLLILNEDKKNGTGSTGGTTTVTQIKDYGSGLKFIPNRWYEQYAQGGG